MGNVSIIFDEGLRPRPMLPDSAEAVAAAAAVRDEFAVRAGGRGCGCRPDPIYVRKPERFQEPPQMVDGKITPEWFRATYEYWRDYPRRELLLEPRIHSSWWETHG